MPKKPKVELSDDHVDEFVPGWPDDVTWTRWGGVMLPETFWVEWINESDEPDLRVEYRLREGRVECSDLHVRAHEDGREVAPSDMRHVRLDWIRERAVLATARGVQSADAKTDQSRWPRSFFTADGKGDDAALIDELRRGRKSTPENKRRVAEIYLRHEKAGDAITEIADTFGIEERQAWNRVKRATEDIDPKTGKPYLSGRNERRRPTNEQAKQR